MTAPDPSPNPAVEGLADIFAGLVWPIEDAREAAAAVLASAYLAARDAAQQRIGAERALREAAAEERGLRLDNADLARQLSEASARRTDAYNEGYDRAMQDAHYVLNQRGYLERRSEDNGNPYRADRIAQEGPQT